MVAGHDGGDTMTRAIAAKDVTEGGLDQPRAAVSAAKSAAPVVASWRTEDWVATILGFGVIAVILALFAFKAADLRNAVSSFRWTTDAQIASSVPGWNAALDGVIAEAETKKQQNVAALATGVKNALAGNSRKAIETEAGKLAALGSRSIAG